MTTPPHKSTYKVTIRTEGTLFVARDDQGEWRTKGSVSGYDQAKYGDIAHWLFHADEIDSSEMVSENECVAMIRQW